jgi:hypothetical protein
MHYYQQAQRLLMQIQPAFWLKIKKSYMVQKNVKQNPFKQKLSNANLCTKGLLLQLTFVPANINSLFINVRINSDAYAAILMQIKIDIR